MAESSLSDAHVWRITPRYRTRDCFCGRRTLLGLIVGWDPWGKHEAVNLCSMHTAGGVGEKKLTVRKVDIAATANARLRLLGLGFSKLSNSMPSNNSIYKKAIKTYK